MRTEIISVRENPRYMDKAIAYLQSKWPDVPPMVYDDCIRNSVSTPGPLPQWYLLEVDGETFGCAGLITNDFISRMDLWPWICALYVEEHRRGNGYGKLLLEKAEADGRAAGFDYLYLATDHTGLYEEYGYKYIGQGWHPWGDQSRIYKKRLKDRPVAPSYTIRPERREDYDEIYDLIKTAFASARVKDGDEQDFAAKLRERGGFIPELALVAELDEKTVEGGMLIGHIMLTKTYIEQPDGSLFEVLLVAPLSVLPGYRDAGEGAALMRESLNKAKHMGYKAIMLVGDPSYYSRFGFRSVTGSGIRPKGDIPLQFVQVCELVPGVLEGVTGIADCC